MTDRPDHAEYPPLGGPDGAAFAAALGTGSPHVARCRACEFEFYYPRPFCPRCLHDEIDLVPCTGPLTVLSYTYVYRVQSPIFEESVPALMLALAGGDGLRIIVEGSSWNHEPQIGATAWLACKQRPDQSYVLVGEPDKPLMQGSGTSGRRDA